MGNVRRTIQLFARTLFLVACIWGCFSGGVRAATLTVNTTSDADSADGSLSLREALKLSDGKLLRPVTAAEKGQISGANWVGGFDAWTPNALDPNIGPDDSDTIVFNSNVNTILNPGSGYPDLGRNDNLNGNLGGGQRVRLDGSGAGNSNGITVFDDDYLPTKNRIENLSVRNFQRSGIYIGGPQGCVLLNIEAYSNGLDGISLDGFPNPVVGPRNNQVGGSGSGRCYLYLNSRNGLSIFADSGDFDQNDQNNTIFNCYAGLKDATGNSDQGNGANGIYLDNAWGNLIDSNVVSGNNNDGIKLAGALCRNNVITGNRIGLSANGLTKIGNNASAVAIVGGGSFNLVGAIGEYNEICGSPNGVFLDGNNNDVINNFIGTNDSSSPGLGNTYGVIVFGTANNIGFSGMGNVICANGTGINVRGAGTEIGSNYIGTNAAMAAGLGNNIGVSITHGASGNIVGGISTDRNYIEGNGIGVEIGDANTRVNQVIFNAIGINPAGNALGPANGIGVNIRDGALNNTIGGASGRTNQIMGCTSHGIRIAGATTTGNKVSNNVIGGGSGFGNGSHGLLIDNSPANQIGLNGEPNVISGNAHDGIQISGSLAANNKIQANVIGLNIVEGLKQPNGFSGIALLNGAHDNKSAARRPPTATPSPETTARASSSPTPQPRTT